MPRRTCLRDLKVSCVLMSRKPTIGTLCCVSIDGRRAPSTSSPVQMQEVCDKGDGGGAQRELRPSKQWCRCLAAASSLRLPLRPRHLLNTELKWNAPDPLVRLCSPRRRRRGSQLALAGHFVLEWRSHSSIEGAFPALRLHFRGSQV